MDCVVTYCDLKLDAKTIRITDARMHGCTDARNRGSTVVRLHGCMDDLDLVHGIMKIIAEVSI